MTSKATSSLEHFLQQRMTEGNISSTTLVFTFFCDVVTQHGGEIWLGSVIHALAPLGINERLTRTAAFRLVQDGWLESRKQGRRSYYRLSPTGQNYYKRAAKRIYASSKPEWDGIWTLLFVSLVPEEKRETLKRGLLWSGYGRMAAGVYALPSKAHPVLDELLADLGLQDSVVQMQAQSDCDESLKKLVLSRWRLDDLRHRYAGFISHYHKTQKILNSRQPPGAHLLLLLRVLLIHEYRKILLSDPELPAAMLPADWEASAAQSLTSNIYCALAVPTAQWVNSNLHNADGLVEADSSGLQARLSTLTTGCRHS